MNEHRAAPRTASFALLAALLLPLLGCEDECGPGYESQGHMCVQPFGAAGSGGAAGGGASGAGSGGDSGAGAGCKSTFAEPCFANTDCSCDASFCAGYPGEEGICTRTGCLEDPAQCPEGWGCMDLSTILPGLPSICTAP